MVYRILLVAASLLALPAQAQGVYKVVGADGKITYTDRPPAPTAEAVVKPFGRQPATRPERAAPATAPVPAKLSVVDAAVRVHIAQRMVASAGRFCHALSASPTSTSRAQAASKTASHAVEQWEFLHGQLGRQKDAVLRDQFTKAALRQLAEATQREDKAVLVRLAHTPEAAQVAWCRQLNETLFGDEFYLRNHPGVAEALMNYRPRKLGRPGPLVQG